MSKEATARSAMKLALEALEFNCVMSDDGEDLTPMKIKKAITALREALAEQPAQQEPIDKNGSPCPEFWDWLSKAYNFEGLGNFTKYNMEVAFLAGKQNTSPPAQRKPLTDEQIAEIAAQGHQRWIEFARAIEAAHGIKGKSNG